MSLTDVPPTVRVEVVAWKEAAAAAGRSALLCATGCRLGATGRLAGLAAPRSPRASRTGLLLPVLIASPIRDQRATWTDDSFHLATSAW
ncbi:hypothetical protein [Streptosporangium brasiliense]|uniref:Uncharacterized protein n=1 Tax=Streptosporangium brasiliense TaxID=47480 RepID=A0ABT9QZT4_9ACTN|nr:hypothetical protein [Streptosporangium brasiliense]MDP9862481.1 hypothetical protein [Streptosporangium brasiliense]